MSNYNHPIKRFLLWLAAAPDVDAPRPALPRERDAAGAGDFAATAGGDASSQAVGSLVSKEHAAAGRGGSRGPADPIDLANEAAAYGVTLARVDIPVGAAYWRVQRVRHLSPEENHGNHHLFLDALDEAGQRSFGAQTRVTWPGGNYMMTVDKPLAEPGANFPLWKWQICSVEMLGLPSDRVGNLHTGHPDEPPGLGNTLFHHSFEVVFQRSVKQAGDPVPPPPEPPAGDDKALARVLLFGPPASPRTAVYLHLAREALAAQRATLSFHVEEAKHARLVLLLGGLEDISQADEALLRAAGCAVQRIAGAPDQIIAALAAALR